MEIKISQKLLNQLLNAYDKQELEEILTEELNRRYFEYLKEEAAKAEKMFLEGDGSGIVPKGLINATKTRPAMPRARPIHKEMSQCNPG